MHSFLLFLAVAPGVDPKNDVVLVWNEATLSAIKAESTPPPLASRNLAIVHAAIFDAVNGVVPLYRPYKIDAVPPAEASATAAAAVAAHRTLVSLYPQQVEKLDAALDHCLDAIPEEAEKTRGIAWGQTVAEKMLQWRGSDGMDRRVSYKLQPGPGIWQPTPPDYRSPLLPQWPQLTCFCMTSADQFRPKEPPPLGSPEYTQAFNTVKALGEANSPVRTREQTEIAWFWADGDKTVTPPGHWNRIAQTVSRDRGLTMEENARLFALLNLALADAGILCWDCKYHFSFWRPVQAIRQADLDGNADTSADPNWTPLLTTPPFPAYTSGHSTFSSAGAAALACFFGTDRVRFASTSDGLPGVTRSFDSFWAAAEEAGMSRIYGGIHWDFDNQEGLRTGRALAEYVCKNYLLPRSQPDVRLKPIVVPAIRRK